MSDKPLQSDTANNARAKAADGTQKNKKGASEHHRPRPRLEEARFIASAPKLKDCPPQTMPELAFAGRSNAGKSSALNALTGQNGLARTSKTPGRTRALNFFQTRPGMLVDLPGYGYAKVSHAEQAAWAKELDRYLTKRDALCGIVLIVDSRHLYKPFDEQMIQWCASHETPLHILLSKADKLKQAARMKALKEAKALLPRSDAITVQLFSSSTLLGLAEAHTRILQLFDAGWSLFEPEDGAAE